MNLKGAVSPSFEEGALRPTNKCHVTFVRAQRGRSDAFLQEAFDLPGRAECDVALHSLIGAATPPQRRGNLPSRIHSHVTCRSTGSVALSTRCILSYFLKHFVPRTVLNGQRSKRL